MPGIIGRRPCEYFIDRQPFSYVAPRAATPASWALLGLFCAVSIADYVFAGSVMKVGPLTDRIGTSPAGIAAESGEAARSGVSFFPERVQIA